MLSQGQIKPVVIKKPEACNIQGYQLNTMKKQTVMLFSIQKKKQQSKM